MKQKIHNRIFLFFTHVLLLFACSLLMLWYINRFGHYPWGSDTYGHLYKANLLYDQFQQGKWFLNYSMEWYNGFQPFRFWAPLPYYVIASIQLFTHDIFQAFQYFLFFLFMLGGIGWLLWGLYVDRQWLTFFIGILWFFAPDNLRVIFSEGNLPFCIVIALLPSIYLVFYRALREKRILFYILLAILMAIVTLCHAMLAAMIGISFFVFCMIDVCLNKDFFNKVLVLIYALLGIFLSSFWLIPALNGGIIGMDSEGTASVMATLSYPFTVSLNPILRLDNIEVYYFGLSFAFIALFTVIFGSKKQMTGAIVGLFILSGTTTFVLPLLQKMPLNQLLWMRRFTAIAMVAILLSFVLWKQLRKGIVVSFIVILAIDSAVSFYALGFNREFPKAHAQDLELATSVATQRVAMLDSSIYGSFPSYYLSYHDKTGVRNQVYGWSWQGATTSENIVQVNTALEHEYYDFLFDRTLELGADTLVLSKDFVKHSKEMEEAAKRLGYELIKETDLNYIYKYPVQGEFGTKVKYEGIAIGKYAPNITYLFPQLFVGEKTKIDEYSYEELKDYKTVYISGLDYKNKQAAEQLLKKLTQHNVRVVIDTAGMDEEFLNVRTQSITLNHTFGDLFYKGEKLEIAPFPKDETEWRTNFISSEGNTETNLYVNHQILPYSIQEKESKVHFVALNLPYYTFLTKDDGTRKILEDVLGLQAYQLPKREVVPIQVKQTEHEIEIQSNQKEVVAPIAAIDAFETISGKYESFNHLLKMQTEQVKMRITYPYIKIGSLLSIVTLCIISFLSYFINRIRKRKEGAA